MIKVLKITRPNRSFLLPKGNKMTKKIKFLKDYYCEVLAFKKDKTYEILEEDEYYFSIKDETNIDSPILKNNYDYNIIEEPEAPKTSALEDRIKIRSEYQYIGQQQGHPHKKLIKKAAELAEYTIDVGSHFQIKTASGEWVGYGETTTLPNFSPNREFRLKPRTIKIGNREINAPERNAPNEGQTYYIPSFCVFNLKYSTYVWRENDFHMKYHLENGLVFLTKEDAIASVAAIIELLRGDDK